MKKVSNPVLPPSFKGEGIPLEPCVECRKPIVDGYFGRYEDGGVCSKVCDILHLKKRNDQLFEKGGTNEPEK